MSKPPPVAVRAATWWVDRYTHTAPPREGADRRAELRSDLHDQLAQAEVVGLGARTVSRSIVARMLRGMPADVAWRLQVERAPGRLEWHLAHPSSVLGAFFVLLAPAVVLLDASRGPVRGFAAAQGMFALVVTVLASAAISFAAVAVVWRLARRPLFRMRTGPGPVRRAALCWMCATWALAALWRFFGDPLQAVSAAAWAAFGVALVVYIAAAFGSVLGRALTLGRYLPKVGVSND